MKKAMIGSLIILAFVLGTAVPSWQFVAVRPHARKWTIRIPAPYETILPTHWRVVSEYDYGRKSRIFESDLDFMDADGERAVAAVRRAGVPLSDSHVWGYIDQIEIEIPENTTWLDVDDAITAALRSIPMRPSPWIHDPELDRAAKAWSAALHTPVKTPRLRIGECRGLVIFPVACANTDTYSITAVRGRLIKPEFDLGIDRYSIYLHEIGHLLGVPHLPGDPLMDPEYQSAVARPTAAAIAKARRPAIDENEQP